MSTNIPITHKIPEACRRISVPRTRMFQLIKDGQIVPIKVGGRTLIPESELQRFVDSKLAVARQDQ